MQGASAPPPAAAALAAVRSTVARSSLTIQVSAFLWPQHGLLYNDHGPLKGRVSFCSLYKHTQPVLRPPEAGLWSLVVQLLLWEAAGDDDADGGGAAEVSTAASSKCSGLHCRTVGVTACSLLLVSAGWGFWVQRVASSPASPGRWCKGRRARAATQEALLRLDLLFLAHAALGS